MKNYYRYSRVMNEDTNIIELSTNNFIALLKRPYRTIWTNNHPVKVYYSLADQPYHIDRAAIAYHDYVDKILAMEKAKEGALKYIESLIEQGNLIASTLKQYRMAHYEDLNENLLDRKILELERAMKKG